jgi:hypothetical protein
MAIGVLIEALENIFECLNKHFLPNPIPFSFLDIIILKEVWVHQQNLYKLF